MPTSQPILVDNLLFDPVNGAITQFACLVATTLGDNYCAMPPSGGSQGANDVVGVAQEAVALTTPGGASLSGHPVAVMTDGVATCVASAAIAAGAWVTVAAGASGKVVTAAGTSTQFVIGKARTAAAANNDQILVKLALGSNAKFL